MNNQQKIIIDEWINTSNYIYNKTLSHVKKTNNTNFQNLRDLFITNNTKKNNILYIDISNKILILHNKIKDLNNEIKKSKDDILIEKTFSKA